MNSKTNDIIIAACEEVIKRGLTLCRGGAHFEVKDNQIVSCDPITATLMVGGFLPELDFSDLNQMAHPGIIEAAWTHLGLDPLWLYRFWMGYDRDYQIILIKDEGDKTTHTKDDVSKFGIFVAKKFKDHV